MDDYENAMWRIADIQEHVQLLADPSDVQKRWLVQNRFPTDELLNMFEDIAPGGCAT
jgi:hypothetical protein